MSAVREADLRAEAEAAWTRVARRRHLPPGPSLSLLATVVLVGVATLTGVGARFAVLFDGRSWALTAVFLADVGLAVLLLGVPFTLWRAARSRARAAVEAARGRRHATRCPRCGAPLLARDVDAVGARACGACDATLLEAGGLLIHDNEAPRWRALRWEAAAEARLGPAPSEPAVASAALSPVLWLGAVVVCLGALWSTGALVGGAVGLPPRAMEAPLGFEREVPHHGRAHAQPFGDAALPAGPTTRPRAPAWVGTQALARRGSGPHHQLAVVVRLDPPRAFVVFADGDSDWVRRRDLLAPEIAVGDEVEVFDGDDYRVAEVVERVGPALRVRDADGAERWTSASRWRVRRDARHLRGEGLESEIPPGAWVESRVGDGVYRPGLAVGSREDGLRVAGSDGGERWVPSDDVRPQDLAPGVRVWIDGWREPALVSARIGHALAVVGADGARGWTALSRVRRP
ncbi:MAG TPA: zf-TFIIB domain-containing protein [Sandaracinaceae bacterium LLY-WYZ-13_1]|nr:zf-TFIIB domain-containing protein [Sandaracinaceae bacterium LLY-WYZ-13_1]